MMSSGGGRLGHFCQSRYRISSVLGDIFLISSLIGLGSSEMIVVAFLYIDWVSLMRSSIDFSLFSIVNWN